MGFKSRFLILFLSFFCWGCALATFAAEKFEILPDLPEPLASAAQASSVSTQDATVATQSIGQEPNLVSLVFSLLFVILLIYATGIVYTKLNKFGAKALKNQTGGVSASHASVISTTPLGNNKTLHIIELDGKRMLIGASVNSIHLIKDLGSYPLSEIEEGEYSKIEIPNIRIPKIEIPKIEFPGFTKVVAKKAVEEVTEDNTEESQTETQNESDNFEISEIYEENSDGIIDKLFHTSTEESTEAKEDNEHKVDPDEYALYKKYLG